MSVVQSVHPCEAIVNRLANLRTWGFQALHHSKVGLGLGLAVSALAGAPMPLPQISLLGPLVAACAAGKVGARAAAAVGFVAFLTGGSGPAETVAGAAIALLTAWGVPKLVARAQEDMEAQREMEGGASAVVIDCDGFGALDDTYGPGTSGHVFNLLHRALKHETRESDMVVHSQGQELILILDGSSPAVAQAVMERVERRFAGWLVDAGYECNLSVGLAGMDPGEGDFDSLLRAARRTHGEPYLD